MVYRAAGCPAQLFLLSLPDARLLSEVTLPTGEYFIHFKFLTIDDGTVPLIRGGQTRLLLRIWSRNNLLKVQRVFLTPSFCSSFKLAWATDQWVKIFSILCEILLSYSNWSIRKWLHGIILLRVKKIVPSELFHKNAKCSPLLLE